MLEIRCVADFEGMEREGLKITDGKVFCSLCNLEIGSVEKENNYEVLSFHSQLLTFRLDKHEIYIDTEKMLLLLIFQIIETNNPKLYFICREEQALLIVDVNPNFIYSSLSNLTNSNTIISDFRMYLKINYAYHPFDLKYALNYSRSLKSNSFNISILSDQFKELKNVLTQEQGEHVIDVEQSLGVCNYC